MLKYFTTVFYLDNNFFEDCFVAAGHFTQVVWKSSRELGVGVASNGGRVLVVANYDPPGKRGGGVKAPCRQYWELKHCP